MSTKSTTTRGVQRRAKHLRDSGLTLPELLIVITVMGALAAVLSTALIVTLRQATGAEGRANVARAETAIDTWLPADLASTDIGNTALPAVNLDPAAEPCGNCGSIDLSGANALQLAWTTTVPGTPPATVTTRVQYQYIQLNGEWQIRRISCVGAQPCKVAVMLHDLDGPPDPASYNPNVDRPVCVLDVAVPVDPVGLDLDDNARQVVVTIDGGGDSAGAGGGENSVSLTAGGRTTEEIDADEFTVPSFVRAVSRCGGPVTLIVDDSGSIGDGNMTNVVRPGVEAFIEAFRGTPTQLQLVRFDSEATVLGPGGDWHRYMDMTDDAAVDALLGTVDSLAAGGLTNWEDAFFRTFKNFDGTPADTLPNRVVFFTDGLPSVNRATLDGEWWSNMHNGAQVNFNAGVYNRAMGWPTETGAFHQESFDRADALLDDHRNVDMIFVGVGGGLQANVNWQYDVANYQNPNLAPPAAESKTGADVLAYLLANASSGQVPAVYDAGTNSYTNPETADYYLQTSFDADAFAAAMKAAALKDCGGTLTVQTRDASTGQPVSDEFVYENPEYRDDTGTPIPADARRVTTSTNFRTGTFDFEISAETQFFSVDIVPSELQTLEDYTPVGWSCRAGADAKTGLTPIPIDGSPFEGFTVDVAANEAVSCILEVIPS